MIVKLIKKTKIYNFTLPTKIAGNYWITDNDYLGNVRNLINVEEYQGQWKIKSDFETKIMNGEMQVESAILKEYNLYFLKVNNENEYVILYCCPSNETNVVRLRLRQEGEITIGNDPRATISYNYPLISKQQARLIYSRGKWIVQDLNSRYGTYANNFAVTSKNLEYGDIIFIMGLKIIVLKDCIILNSISNLINYDQSLFIMETPPTQHQIEMDNPDEEGIEFYKEDDYFYRSPRFKTMIEPVNIGIDSPPGKEAEDKTPLIYTIGPMLTMASTTVSSAITALNSLADGTNDWANVWPTIATCGVTLATMMLWPMLSKHYQNKQRKKKEVIRQQKYSEYINSRRAKIQSEMKIQRQILIDNYLPLNETREIIANKKRNLWERELDQDDFLDLRLGIGTKPLEGNINFPEEHFSIETDNLLSEVYKLGAESRMLENVPISLSFITNRVVAIIGSAQNKQQFIEGLILQMLTYHSYEDLKLIIMTNDKNSSKWDYLKIAPHCWSDDKHHRYFANSLDEARELSLVLEKELQARKYKDSENSRELSGNDYHHYKPYYVLITDDYKLIRDVEIVKDIAGLSINVGFSLIVISQRLVNLPNECKTFISIGEKKSGVFENELIANKQKEFIADYDPNINMYDCCKSLANIPIDIAKESQSLPDSLTFLEMYNVGMVEQLNILNRWKTNDPTKSLQAPVGYDKTRELFKLDLHEKFHGPHGLIAGMTGSGKSEFIITYIVSMAINYHPYEVSFVLIDYKGGGLAGVFQNKETGFKLPHLAGTITNLDTVEMNRSLASIQSELRKRQMMFNEARDKLNESTIDIYKYQSLYRQGLVDKPISHLIIISDEFAELKDQRPDFMDQLISTARIGRSLGVHLILATQKPAGVVNDQIWSNSKFRVCLRVQDKSDSMDMIKCPDAAALRQAGRFYLQVGYNELFAQGQAAWAGAQYYPTEKRKKKVDQSINFVDDTGNNIKSMDNKQNGIQVVSHGEEITNIVKYIVDQAKQEHIEIPQLWLDRIPDIIFVEDLKKKYHYVPSKNLINPIIGEYDDPDNQRQSLLTLPISTEGNAIVYGTAGSGKENLLTTLIYSTITGHDSKEVNFYILDFGAETLGMFKNAPHIGEVLTAPETEKIANLFKLINQIIEDRKKVFVDYNGSYDFYINHGGKQIPFIIIIINNVEAFIDNYPDYEDMIGQMTRDCFKYGVVFILSTNGPNTVRYRLRQNFRQHVVLQFNDPGDYGTVINGARKKEPSKNFGRGLIGLDGIYEYQTAYVYREEKMVDYVKVICNKLNNICTYQARKIPTLPSVVTLTDIIARLKAPNFIPVGIAKETLEITGISLKKGIYNITGEDITAIPKIIRGITKVLARIPNSTVIMLDANTVINNAPTESNVIYDTGACTKGIEELTNALYAKEVDNNENLVICMVSGMLNIIGKMDVSTKNKFLMTVDKCLKNGTIKFVFIETIDAIKNLNYEQWYKGFADLSEGMWIGNGINNQFTIKTSTSSRVLRAEVEPNFGWVVEKGKANLVKFIEEE